MNPVRIDVPTPSRRYTITLGHGILDRLPRLLDEAGAPARRFVVSSQLIWQLHGSKLARAGLADPIITVEAVAAALFKHVPRAVLPATAGCGCGAAA